MSEKVNLIGGFGKGWIHRFACDNSTNNEIETADGGNCAVIRLDSNRPVLQKYEYKTEISPNGVYKISAEYECDAASALAPYALISLYDKEGTVKRRLYLRRPKEGMLELLFESENETELVLELGLKQAGCVKWQRPLLQTAEALSERKAKIASVYMQVKGDGSYDENLKRMTASIEKAANAGADLVMFAETMADRGTGLPDDVVFESEDGRLCKCIKEKAAECGCYVMFTYHEKDADGIRHNTALLIDRKGNTAGRYVKTHQALVEYERGMVPGNTYPVFDTDFGKVGMLICWDAYFPEPAKVMAQNGAEILLVSTAGNPTVRHVARAKENGVYVAVSCAAAEGHIGLIPTEIISPSGEILANANIDGDIAIAEIDFNKNDYIFWLSVGGADSIPKDVYMNECRDDLYGLL